MSKHRAEGAPRHDRRDDWIGALQALAESFFAVFRSEWEVLSEAWWSGTLKKARNAAILFLVAAFLLLLFLALLVVASVLIVAIWVEPWLATLIVAGAVLAVALTMAAVGYFVHVRSLENPIATAQRRLADHLEWWRERLLESGRALPEGESDGEPTGAQGPGAADGEPSAS